MADIVMQGHVAPAHSLDTPHETADIDGKRVWETAGALAGMIVLAALMAAGAIALIGTMLGRPLARINPPPTRMPSPPLQSAPPLDLHALRAEKHALLSQYAWIDRAHGVVRIPIDRAIEIMVERGKEKPR
ncbi:MAG TPA: hypothetical protein VJ891_18825 [Casimicrobiaceae bacterium]|nr:hypothetical protein [Casimicrobiaceae bacterium]